MLKTQIEKAGLPKDKFEIGIISGEEFISAMNGLNQRREQYRDKGILDKSKVNIFDNISVLFIDFDLFDLRDNQYFKADTIAYLVRAFSTCGIIVRVNRFGHNPFDLTLKGDLSSFADLDVGFEQISNPTLWGLAPTNGFSPWYWPNLPAFAADFEKRVIDVENAIKLGISIQDVLGFSNEIWAKLPRAIVQFFGGSEANMQFKEFLVASQHALEFKDGQNVEKKLEIEKKVVDWTIFSRLAAARISKWLEYTVLKEQDILVDAPHLVSRFPSLLKDNKDINTWNGLCVRGMDKIPGLDMAIIKPFQLKKIHWVSRPVWFWQGIVDCHDIAEVREPWNIDSPDWVFCEDASAFYKEDECREFKAETISPFAGRYVKSFSEVDYFPRERFAL
jgi:hypothetical protein